MVRPGYTQSIERKAMASIVTGRSLVSLVALLVSSQLRTTVVLQRSSMIQSCAQDYACAHDFSAVYRTSGLLYSFCRCTGCRPCAVGTGWRPNVQHNALCHCILLCCYSVTGSQYHCSHCSHCSQCVTASLCQGLSGRPCHFRLVACAATVSQALAGPSSGYQLVHQGAARMLDDIDSPLR